MNIYKGFEHKFTNAVAIVGSFDGVHKGHRLLIDLLNEQADKICGDSVVITFDPLPKQVFGGDSPLLTTLDERLYLLELSGARNVVVINFTKEFASIDASAFVQDYLVSKLGVSLVFTGSGHTFGRNRGGGSSEYNKFGICEVNIERLELISSTQVRELIQTGNMELATQLLSSHYLVFTPISNPAKLLPPSGSYQCDIDGQSSVMSMDELAAVQLKSRVFIKNKL